MSIYNFIKIVKNAYDAIAELIKYFTEKIKQGHKNIVVKLLNVPPGNNPTNKITDIASNLYINIMKKNASFSVSFNSSQMVYEIYFN